MKRRILALLLVLMIVFSSFSTFAEEEVDLLLIEQILDYIESYHHYEVDRETLVQGAYKGILDTLDQHSAYFSESEYDKFISDLDGEFIGVGIYVEAYESYIRVVSPIEGMPADLAGLKTGDLITHVDGKSTKNYTFDVAIDMILGEENTEVILTINRGGEVFDVKIIRKLIDVPDVTYKILDDNTGYLKIVQFGQSVSKEVNDAMVFFNEAKVKNLVIDLRNNPGGYLNQVVEVAEWFVDAGEPILHVTSRQLQNEDYYGQLKGVDMNISVLVNEGTASASEILAGAIKFNNKGKIFGTTTYGKGTVQNLISLRDGSAIKLTTAEYLAAYKNPVNNIGIEPDFIVETKIQEVPEFVPMISDQLASFHKTGLDVYGAQQRLNYLGYDLDLTGRFDRPTLNVLELFQDKHGLKKFALYDETKQKLEEEVQKKINSEDSVLEEALEWLKTQ
jgi:carboxyl-terminal processing protease